MNKMTLKQLRYFEATARIGHFGKASKACAVSQPALSMQIRELEAGLGAPLFERSSRQTRLTSIGEQFLIRASDILAAVDELEDLVRAGSQTISGRLRIGVIPTIAPYLLPGIISQLGESYPELEINIRETQTHKLVSELTAGKLDTAVLALPLSEPAIEEVPLLEEEFVLVRSSRDGHLPVPGPQSLDKMKLLLLEEGHCFREQALSFCKIGSTTPREVLDGSSLSTLVQMVGAGIGVTLIPEMAIDIETRSADVSISRFRDVKPTRTIGMAFRSSNPLSVQLRQIAEVLLGAINP